jgi:hypothetical protein
MSNSQHFSDGLQERHLGEMNRQLKHKVLICFLASKTFVLRVIL